MRIVPIGLREANDFVDLHHRHSARTANDGGKFAIGLESGGAVVAVAIVGRPVARLLQAAGTAEVLRMCAGPDAPDGACSKLYARCKRIWQLMGGTRIVTYALASESGGSIVGAGFVREATVRGRQWDTPTRRRGDRAIAGQPKYRYGARMPELPL